MEFAFLAILLSLLILSPPLVRWFQVISGNRTEWNPVLVFLLDATLMLVLPLLYLFSQEGTRSYGCCGDDAALFDAAHAISLQAPMAAAGVAFLVLTLRKSSLPPLLELLLLGALTVGIGLCALIIVQGADFVLPGIVAWVLNVLWMLRRRSRFLVLSMRRKRWSGAGLQAWARKGLMVRGLGLVLLIACGGFVFIALALALLRLFGQPYDALVLTFTQTYTHTFSELTYDCSQIDCGGMFLCTIGARGHARVVGPTRPGRRNGDPITCSRQLLVSNAFEASLAHRFPKLQALGRKAYDRLGRHLDPNRALFRSAWLCDAVHLAMKPAEWAFLAWLFLVEPEPQALIARQYRV
ncbi:MAG: hypothetical protein RL318_2815 [Fibrobacterota bacterium]|jgi:hypothetical protein